MPLIESRDVTVPVGVFDRMDRAGDITMAALYERHLKDVFHYVLRRVPRIEEAEDITAEVFAAAAAGLPRFRGHCPPYLWLLSIARRQIALARRRRTARRETLASELADDAAEAGYPRSGRTLWETLAATEGPEAAVLRSEARRVLGDLVSGLSDDQREALMLQYVEQLSLAEIALVMGRSPGSVKGLLQRARAAIHRQGHRYFLGDGEG